MNEYYNYLNDFLGLDKPMLTIVHMSCRAIIVFFFGFFITKINKRFLAMRTQFNFVLFIMLGSILATAITGNAPFFPVLGMTLLLISLNWTLVKLSYHFNFFEKLFKGTPALLIKDGQYQWKSMKNTSVTPTDLLTELRKHGTDNIQDVKESYMENDGTISFILQSKRV